jgi:hypothetical protein
MAKKSTNAFEQFSENLTKAFQDASARFGKHFEKGLEAQRQAIKNSLKMSPSLEQFNRQMMDAFKASGERFREGLEQAFELQREAIRKAAPALKKSLSEMPMAGLGERFRSATLAAIGSQQKAFAASARSMASAFERFTGESMKTIGAVTRRAFEEMQKKPAAADRGAKTKKGKTTKRKKS